MGSCISKCRPRKISLHQLNHHHVVQDKLVISQTPPPPPPLSLSNKISPFPLSPSYSSSSVSSFTCNTSTSNVSTATSSLSSKDHRLYFSNEFLYSCYKENPHIIRINSLKQDGVSSSKPRHESPELDFRAKSVLEPAKQPSPHRVSSSTQQKRARSRSPAPNLTRQKSFRKEPVERPINSRYLLTDRTLRSPSPSRRFTGEKGRVGSGSTIKVNHSKGMVKSASPNNNLTRPGGCNVMNRETCIHRIGGKIDERGVGEDEIADGDVDLSPVEDIDNPLISLDCFIFL